MARAYETTVFQKWLKGTGMTWRYFDSKQKNEKPYQTNPHFDASKQKIVKGSLAVIEDEAKKLEKVKIAERTTAAAIQEIMKKEVDLFTDELMMVAIPFITHGTDMGHTNNSVKRFVNHLRKFVERVDSQHADQRGARILGLAQFIYDNFINVKN